MRLRQPEKDKMQKLNRDLMNQIPTRVAATSTMAVIDRLQDMPVEVQLIALTAAYKLMVERFGIDGHDVFAVADNIMHHADGRRVEFVAIADYLRNEL